MRINNQNNINFKNAGSLSGALGEFYNPNATLPTLFIESGVTGLRTYEANKAKGKKAAVERFVEQGISALVWIYGVKNLQKIGEFFGKKLFKDADAFKDGVEKSEDLIKRVKDFDFDIGFDNFKNPIKDINPKISTFKAANMLFATALSTYFIGFVLPKINHKISKKFTNEKEQSSNSENKTMLKKTNIEDFKKQVAFKGNLINTTAHILENNSTARLFITDIGVVSGRCINEPKKIDKIGGLIRDISSIFFYLKSTDLFVKGLNKLTNTVEINPKTSEKMIELINSKDQTKEEVINNLPKWIKDDNFITSSIDSATKGKFSDPLGYVSQGKIKEVKKSISDFSELLISKLKDKNITDENLSQKIKDISKSNSVKNLGFYVAGTILSTLALGVLIPKVQYYIMNKLENKERKQ